MKTSTICRIAIVLAALVAVVWNGCSREGGAPAYKTIHEAAKAGDAEAVAAFLKSNAELVNAKDEQGFLPLHIAAAEGHKAVVEVLLTNKAEVDARGPDNRTALHLAAAKGHKAVVEVLLDNKADVNAKNEFGWTPLHLAANDGYKETVELLLARNADVEAKTNKGNTALNLAAKKEHTAVVELLQKTPGSGQQGKGTTGGANASIFEAAKAGDIERVKALMKANPDVLKSVDDKGRIPLFHAVIGKQKEMVEFLIANGCDPNAKSSIGHTPLHFAAFHGFVEGVKILLENKANPNVHGGSENATPMHVATIKGFPEVIQVLAAYGADPNARDRQGYTPLFQAVAGEQENTAVVEALLKAKANPNLAMTVQGQNISPLQIANQKGYQQSAQLLRRYGARR